ncbi:MAG: CHASE3 domain-containing protein, partial [Burkholderiaceae bacterium]
MWLGLSLVVLPVLALLALETYVVLANAPELRRNRQLVVHTFEVITGAQTLQRAVQDAERGQRGYLITGDPAYLAPYRKSTEDIPWLLDRLRKLNADSPEHRRRIENLDLLTRRKLAELRESLEVSQAQGPEAAREFVRLNIGRDTMDAINASIDGHIAGESFQLTDQLARAADDERRMATLAAWGGALALAIMTLGAALGWMTLRRIARSEAARRESEARFHMFVEGVTDYAICMLD